MPGPGRRFIPKLTHEQELALAIRIVERMASDNITAKKAIRLIRPEYGVSEAYCYRVLERQGFPTSSLTPETVYRHTKMMARATKLYTLVEKQRIVNRLMALADLEAEQIESEYRETGVMTDKMAQRTARAVAMLNRGIAIDEKLNKAGVPIDGFRTPEPEGESESGGGSLTDMLDAARKRAAELRAERERLTA